MSNKITIEKININPSSCRKFFYIIKTNKERQNILNEASYYSSIYTGLTDRQILEVVIEKYIKMRLFNVVFPNNKKDIEEHNKILKDAYKYNLF